MVVVSVFEYKGDCKPLNVERYARVTSQCIHYSTYSWYQNPYSLAAAFLEKELGVLGEVEVITPALSDCHLLTRHPAQPFCWESRRTRLA